MSELTPYLAVADARAAIDWYAAALGAVVTYEPIVMPDGRIGHVELEVAGARFHDGRRAPRRSGRAPISSMLDTAASVDAALAAYRT
jgi:uncharacterized glyoxalase superfamily protein PhnB